MNIAERAIALVAAHRCLACRVEGSLLCESCRFSDLRPLPSRCYRCHKLTRQSAVCTSCRSSVAISHTWVATEYHDIAKQLIYKLKFDRAQDAGRTIAEIIAAELPHLPPDVVVSHIPTANNRVRVRGYDQAQLIARELSKLNNWQYKKLLSRLGTSRQVGAGRKERFIHAQNTLKLFKNPDIAGQHILLVDDVTTTGATIEAAAKILKDGGAKTVDVAVFAQP